MSTIRLSLCSLGYPHIAPNCLVVLQSLMAVGFNLVLRDVYYRDRDSILDYFEKLGLSVIFDTVKHPDIDVLRDSFKINNTKYPFTSWKDVDQACLKENIYSRKSRYSFVPSYKPNTYFIVLNYGEKTQVVDSSAIALSTAKQRSIGLVSSGKSSVVTIVDANTLRIAGIVDKNGYEEFEELIYFNNEL